MLRTGIVKSTHKNMEIIKGGGGWQEDHTGPTKVSNVDNTPESN